MKSITSRIYTTDDGSEFVNKADAVAYELNFKLASTVEASGVENAGDVVVALVSALTGENRAAARDMLLDAIKMSNTLDHKPKSGGRKKGAAVEGELASEAAPKKGKKAAEAVAA